MSNRVIANIDGGARGNPGPAGWGAVIKDHDGNTIAELSGSLPHATNNVAEYTGLLEALRWCQQHGVTSLHIRSDSQLLVQQMLGNYKVKHPGLQPLHARATALAKGLRRVRFEHVRREANAHVDRLANQAMDDAARS